MSKFTKWLAGLFLGLVALVFVSSWIINYQRSAYIRDLKNAEDHLRSLIESEDRYYQETGSYVPMAINSGTSLTPNPLDWHIKNAENCDFAVSVSGLAFVAEVKCPTQDYGLNYLGYARSAPGKQTGIDGKFGKCTAEGIFAGTRKLVNTIGPSVQDSWRTMFVASGSKKRLVIETLPTVATISVDGRELGVSSAFGGTITPSYGYFYMEDPPTTPVAVRVSKEGYAPVEFSTDWGNFTYQAVVVLREIGK